MRSAMLLAALALVCAGCASPRLPAALAGDLATQADAVAARLAAGDTCGASTRLTALRREADAAIVAGTVPAALAPDLAAKLAALGEIRCIRPTPSPTPSPTRTVSRTGGDDDRDGKRGRGKGKRGDEDGDD